MNILFYIEPWIEKARPEWKDVWIEAVLLPLYRAVLSFSDQRCFFLLGDAQRVVAERWLQQEGTLTAIVTQTELRDIFPDYLTASLAWQREMASPPAQRAMRALLTEKLQGFVPDIIISFMMPVPFLRDMFPQALVLHQEVGGFSRAPYPAAWHLDPCGIFSDSFISRFAPQITATPLVAEQQEFMAGFRQTFCDDLLLAKNPFTRQELIGVRPFKHLLLLPLQISDYIAFEGCCEYASQWDMLTHVLEKTPYEIGVVVTEHSDWGRMLTPAADAYLRRAYPHYIHSDRFEEVEYPSQYLLPHVDAVATVSSSVGIQGLLWRKPVCVLGNSHINAMADITDIEHLGKFLEGGGYRDKDNLLYFLLTRYYFMGAAYLWNPTWLEERLRHWLEVYRECGIDTDFFPPIDGDAALLAAYRLAAHPHLPCISRGAAQRQAEQQRLQQIQATVTQLQAANQSLLTELMDARAELQALHTSTSWRVTAPLRKIKDRL